MNSTRQDHDIIVLNVQEEAATREFVSDSLLTEGYRVIAASTGDQALAVMAARHDIHIIVTDLRMSALRGGEALAATVATRWPHIGLVLSTSPNYAPPSEVPEHACYLSKPFTARTLLQAVEAAVDRMSSE